MSKKQNHKKDFDNLLKSYLENQEDDLITNYIINNSNLPGRRGNLEMAEAFYESIHNVPIDKHEIMWSYLINLTKITEKEAPVNTPEELLPFCGILGLTSLMIHNKNLLDEGLRLIRTLSNDRRWRMREAVGMSLTKLISQYPDVVFPEVESWIIKEHWLEIRAIAAGLAEPKILKNNKSNSEKAFHMIKKIFQEIINATIDKKSSESFKVLRKGLGYCLSVIVQFNPTEGFKFMEQLATNEDKDLRWILKENLKKARLAKNFPKEVATINLYLNKSL